MSLRPKRFAKREAEEAELRETARAAHLEELPGGVRSLVAEGWAERDAHMERMDAGGRSRFRKSIKDGAVLFIAVQLLLGGFAAGPLFLAALIGAGVGALWVPVAENRALGLHIGGPLVALPAWVLLHALVADGMSLGGLRHLCGLFFIGMLSAWIGFSREQEALDA